MKITYIVKVNRMHSLVAKLRHFAKLVSRHDNYPYIFKAGRTLQGSLPGEQQSEPVKRKETEMLTELRS